MATNKKSKLTADDLFYKKMKRKHSFNKKQKIALNQFLKKGEKEWEEVNFDLSVASKYYCMAYIESVTFYGHRCHEKYIFLKKNRDKLIFLYDAESLIQDYESNDSSFERFSDEDPNIYLHLAISYWRHKSNLTEQTLQALGEYIKRNPDARGKNVIETIEDNAYLFLLAYEGFYLFYSCYLKMDMLKEAAITYSIFADCHFPDTKKKQSYYGYSYLLSEQYRNARISFREAENYEYFWALGMEKWEGNSVEAAKEAFKKSRKFSEKDSSKEKLINYLLESLKLKKDITSMSLQMSLLDAWNKEARNKKRSVKKQTVKNSILNDLKDIVDKISSLEEEPLPQFEDHNPKYAKKWDSKKDPAGNIINKKQFDELIKNKADYNIFIIDRGEYKMESVGEVYFNNKRMKNLTPLGYRILVYTLERKGFPGDIFAFIKDCWHLPDPAERLKKDWHNVVHESGDPDEFRSSTSTYRKGISVVSKLLTNYFDIQLKTYKKRKYRLSSIPDFCLIELNR